MVALSASRRWVDDGNLSGWAHLKASLNSLLPDRAYIEQLEAFTEPERFTSYFMVSVIFYHGRRHVLKLPAENSRYFPTELFKAKIGLLA